MNSQWKEPLYIRDLLPYESARMITQGKKIFLDANEGENELVDWDGDLSQYPVQQSEKAIARFSKFFGVDENQILMDRGSDTLIKMMMQAFCLPQEDRIGIFTPTYGVYQIFAQSLGIATTAWKLNANFILDFESFRKEFKGAEKIIFLCSPNNPTGGVVEREELVKILDLVNGECLLVVDEAYVEFSEKGSASALINQYDNLLILRTLSKAFGLAGLRVGFALAGQKIISVLKKVQLPYPFDTPTQQIIEKIVDKNLEEYIQTRVEKVRAQREILAGVLSELPFVEVIFPSQANFVLCKVKNADEIYEYLKGKNIIVRKFNRVNIEGTLRLSIKNEEYNNILIKALKEFR